MSSVSKRIHLRDEVKKLHLFNNNRPSSIIVLRCATCKTIHPSSPAALVWWKCLKDKDQLRCRCGSRNFVRTQSKKTQGELLAEVIEKHTKHIKKEVEDISPPSSVEEFISAMRKAEK